MDTLLISHIAQIFLKSNFITKFSAPGSSWRVLTYEVNLISEGTKESFSLAETELLVNITPGIAYTASIKACTISGVCTDFVNATNSAFGPHKSVVPVVIYTKNGDALKMMDLLGRELVDVDGYCKFYIQTKLA